MLETLYSTNPDGLRRIVDSDRSGFARQQAELLLERAEGEAIAGVDKLAKNGGAKLDKFVALLAELRFALLFSSLGARSQLLYDSFFGAAAYAPDLLVQFPSGLELLVEVVHGSSGSPQLAADLVRRLAEEKLPFRVEHFLGYRLSVAVPTANERRENEILCLDVADRVAMGLSEARAVGVSEGVIRVLATGSILRHEIREGLSERLGLYDEVAVGDGETWVGSFAFEPSSLPHGTAGGGVSTVHWLDSEGQKAKFLEKVRGKARRRAALPPAHGATPYVVALQNDEWELQPATVLSALTGSREHLGGGLVNHAKPPSRIAALTLTPWAPLVKEWDYVDQPSVRLADYGAYGNADDVVTNLSGVLVMHQGGGLVQWLPNPFSEKDSNDPRLLQIGLSLAKLGGPPPMKYWGPAVA